MIEERELVERAVLALEPEAPSMEGLLRRRDRARRNQRVASGALALAVALAATLGLVRIFERSTSSVPAAPSISSDNVRSLRQVWSADMSGHSSFPTVDGDQVVVRSTGRLAVYPASCHASCDPIWVANVPGGQPGVAVAHGQIYTGSSDGHLYVFDEACGTAGATCRAAWTLDIGGNVGQPVVAGGQIFATSTSPGRNLRVFAYKDSYICAGRCGPLWQGSIAEKDSFVPVVEGGFLFLGIGPSKLTAFAIDCGRGGATCAPAWAGLPGLETTFASAPVFANGLMYVLTHRGVVGVDPTCLRGGGCKILWRSEQLPGYPPVLNGSVLYLATVTTNELYAFDGTRSCGIPCPPTWTASVPGQPAFGTPLPVGDVVFVATTDGRVVAYPARCSSVSCQALWTASVGSGEVRLASDGRMLFVASTDHVAAYAPQASSSEPQSSSRGAKAGAGVFYMIVATLGAGLIVLRLKRRRRVAR